MTENGSKPSTTSEGMFGQLLEKLDSWVGRSFVLSSFFPLLIFLFANATMALWVIPEASRPVISYIVSSSFGPISILAAFLVAAATLAYVTDPLVDLLTRLLEGDFLPPTIAGWLATDQTKQVQELDENEQRIGRLRAEIFLKKGTITDALSHARARGVAIGAMRNPPLIGVAKTLIDALNAKRDRQQVICVQELEAAARSLADALASNCADEGSMLPGASAPEVTASRTLHLLHSSMRQLIEYAQKKAANDYSRAYDERQQRSALHELPSTRLGNEAAALRSFFDIRFQFNFDFVWPLVLLVLRNDQKATEAIANSKQKLDFCIRLLMYTVLFTVFWLIACAIAVDSELIVIAVGTGGLVLAALWLAILHATYRSFAELVRSIVILKRFDVLTALHQPLPRTWLEEKETWKHISTQLQWGSDADVVYEHPK
jgi:uncharacterized Tic20 family protein